MTILYNDFSYKIITGLVIVSKGIAGGVITALKAQFFCLLIIQPKTNKYERTLHY
jgi:hypothetical protein